MDHFLRKIIISTEKFNVLFSLYILQCSFTKLIALRFAGPQATCSSGNRRIPCLSLDGTHEWEMEHFVPSWGPATIQPPQPELALACKGGSLTWFEEAQNHLPYSIRSSCLQIVLILSPQTNSQETARLPVTIDVLKHFERISCDHQHTVANDPVEQYGCV